MPTLSNIYQEATRLKLRFPYKGQCTVEALWEIPLADLDKIYGELSEEQAKTQKHSLLQKPSKDSSDLNLKIAIVIDVMKTRQEDANEAEQAVFRKQQKEQLNQLIAQKKQAAVAELPLEQLEAMAAKL